MNSKYDNLFSYKILKRNLFPNRRENYFRGILDIKNFHKYSHNFQYLNQNLSNRSGSNLDTKVFRICKTIE